MAEQFDTIVSRHGEHGVQAILENWERHQGISPDYMTSLEARWNNFLRSTNDNISAVAA